jgi:hypothetical protein
VTGETVVYGAGTAQVLNYDAVSGEQLWQFDTGGETTAAPTVAGNRTLCKPRSSNGGYCRGWYGPLLGRRSDAGLLGKDSCGDWGKQRARI